MLYTLLVIVHVFICFLMIGAILLQSGKGAEIGASFGGSSQTVFGSRGTLIMKEEKEALLYKEQSPSSGGGLDQRLWVIDNAMPVQEHFQM